MLKLRQVEEAEREMLFKLCCIFKDSLEDFGTSIDRSLRYLDKIVLPIIMASKRDRSYNPFSEIIEKYVMHILVDKFEKEDYRFLPLGYSGDLTLENNKYILSIDIKTANIDNPSDFKHTVNVGINQMTHVAKLPLNIDANGDNSASSLSLPSPYFVYPTLPPFYCLPKDDLKLILTYGLMFIYPAYRDLINDIREKYKSLFEFFSQRVKKVLIHVISESSGISKEKVKASLEKKPQSSRSSREELIIENLIRGIFIHEKEESIILKSLFIPEKDKSVIEEFRSELKAFIEGIKERNIRPIAIIAISIPNGLLRDFYLDRFVSGKSYANSARYHYEDGIFEVIKQETGEEIPRVVFIALEKRYEKELKKYFKKIIVFDYSLREI